MGTGVATERIKSGQMLVVDGDAGTVTLMGEGDTSPVKQTAMQRQPSSGARKKALLTLAVIAVIGLVLRWRRSR